MPARTWELSQFLIGVLGVEDVGSTYEGTVAYHPTCHSLRLLRVGDAPLRLLRAVPGVELVELPDAEECCGFGGTFAVKNADVSAAMLDEKLAAVVAQRRRRRVRLRQLVPDAHRRRSPPSRHRGAAGAPGGDPGHREQCGARCAARELPAGGAAALANAQVRANIRHATGSIRAKRAAVVAEVPDWEALREAAAAIKDATLARLDEVLVELEASVEAAGGVVHWARDAAEANEIVTALVRAEGADEVVKVKSLATDEIRLNEALEAAGIRPIETDLAELIIQLADERPSHLLVPAIHKNRVEIRDLFRARLGRPDLSDDPAELAEAARLHLREAFLRARVAISGRELRRRRHRHDLRRRVRGQRAHVHDAARDADHGDGDREGDSALPRPRGVPAAVAPLLDRRADEPVHLALDRRPRRRRAERFHLVLLDAGRTRVLADPGGRPALRCIRCSACINVCPVYRQTGGHAYHSPYAGPIGAILAPQLVGESGAVASLPFASSLCGACYDVCPVLIDIPSILVHERGKAVARERAGHRRAVAEAARPGVRDARRLRAGAAARPLAATARRAQRLDHALPAGPARRLGASRDLPALPAQTFREWWESRDRA